MASRFTQIAVCPNDPFPPRLFALDNFGRVWKLVSTVEAKYWERITDERRTPETEDEK